MQARQPHDCWLAVFCPLPVLLVAALEAEHPGGQLLLSGRGQLGPHGWQLPVEEGGGQLLKLTGKADFTSQRTLQVLQG